MASGIPTHRQFAVPKRTVRCFAILAAALAALFLVPSLGHAESTDTHQAKRVAADFYRTYLRLSIVGLPNASQMSEIAPYLSEDLKARFRAARRKEDAAIKANPGDAPPFGDGDLFSSLFEGAQSFYITEPTLRGNNAAVPIHLQRRTPAPAVRWVDTLVLTRTAKGWRILDIKFGGDWQFKAGPSLRENLRLN